MKKPYDMKWIEQSMRRTERDIANMAEAVAGKALSTAQLRLVTGWLDQYARVNPLFAQAWISRRKNAHGRKVFKDQLFRAQRDYRRDISALRRLAAS